MRHHITVGLENLRQLFISHAKSDKLVKNVIPLVGSGLIIGSPEALHTLQKDSVAGELSVSWRLV